ncbi:MAG: aromatic ring-hydroxylating dioxygenase subunit alpha [Nitratireductor sp.]|nr:aromatic ring-hydroxylating dioxygenase subunit alpha [Nitratireductor sp.]
MNQHLSNRDISVPESWDRRGLPGWTYHSPALLELEKEQLFRRTWQIVCHVSDVPDPGSYVGFDLFGERALIVRGNDGEVRAFHNMCRHRGSRVVADNKGKCRNALVCPFHGWVFNLDGTLRGAARPETFDDMDRSKLGLITIEMEIWNGLVFIRFAPGHQPSVAEIMQPFEREIAHYRLDEMVPSDRVWNQTSQVNWKSVRDVDNEGYHVAMAHPALQDLYGATYYDEPFVDGVCRSYADCYDRGGRLWSVRHYIKTLEPRDHIPEELQRAWIYYGLFPNSVVAVTPESMQFYQEFPVSVNETILRGATYRYRDETRRQRAARYLATRIDRDTIEEDVQLTIWSNESMASEAFQGFYLSDLEYGVRTHHDHIRAVLPVTTLEEAPGEAEIARINEEMSAR